MIDYRIQKTFFSVKNIFKAIIAHTTLKKQNFPLFASVSILKKKTINSKNL